MPEIQPFHAVHYAAGGDITRLIAPPYDVLTEADKAALLAGDGRNIVAVDLPHTPPKTAGPAEVYQHAGRTLRNWLADGTMVRDAAPVVYAYQQTFEHAGRKFTRRGFIARIRIEPFRASPTGIFPHEQTFSGPKEDRLMLTRAARCQVSPIFGLYADEHNRIVHELYANLPDRPTVSGRLGGIVHEAWRVDNPRKISALSKAMRERAVFIADGHHRYTTALNYLAELGELAPDHPARFVMFACVSMHDPGLAILPTHRVVTVGSFDLAEYARRLAGAFEVTTVDWTVQRLEAEVLRRGQGFFGVKPADGGQALLLRLAHRDLLDRLEALRGAAYRHLDVAILHRYLVQEVLSDLAGEPLGIEYPHSGADAAAALAARQLDGSTAFGTSGGATGGQDGATKIAFLLAPTPLAAVRDVCLSGELMPQKSTFFYPKLATGLALYDLSE